MMLKKYGFCTGTLLVGEIAFNISCGPASRPETCLDLQLRAWLNVEKSGWICFTIMLKKVRFLYGYAFGWRNCFQYFMWTRVKT